MSDETDIIKKMLELTTVAVTWKQKAEDLEEERDYLRGLLEKYLETKK